MKTKYVIKNKITNKYFSTSFGYTKNIFEALIISHKVVKEDIKQVAKNGVSHSILRKNELFIAVNMSEA